jgi:hypothetical protein
MRVVFDLDGTLADCEHRIPYIRGTEPPDWDAFHALCSFDKPIWPVIELATSLKRRGNELQIWTGRSAVALADTHEWLDNYYLGTLPIRMRPVGDHRPDVELKAEWLTESRAKGWVPDLVIEDRKRMIDFWRSQGIMALQCAEGNF